MIYNIYNLYDKVYMNWIGDYTFGSALFKRGTSVHLKEKCGKILGYPNYFDDVDSIQDSTQLENNDMFGDDNMTYIDSLDIFIDINYDYDDYFLPMTFSQLETAIKDINRSTSEKQGDMEYEIQGYCWEHDKLKNDFYANYDKIKNASKILKNSSHFYVIYDYENMVNELKNVNEIAQANNVVFWGL
jgi:hypothetical protein